MCHSEGVCRVLLGRGAQQAALVPLVRCALFAVALPCGFLPDGSWGVDPEAPSGAALPS